MILTCYKCPRQLCFAGSNRELYVRLFGWLNRGGALFLHLLQG